MADANPELTALLHRVSQESNQILYLCRARADHTQIKKQLAVVLDIIKKILGCVGVDIYGDDVKGAAIELKDAVFQVCQLKFFLFLFSFFSGFLNLIPNMDSHFYAVSSPFSPPVRVQLLDHSETGGASNGGIDYDDEVVQAVMELLTSIKYAVQMSQFDASRHSSRSDSSASGYSSSAASLRDADASSSSSPGRPLTSASMDSLNRASSEESLVFPKQFMPPQGWCLPFSPAAVFSPFFSFFLSLLSISWS